MPAVALALVLLGVALESEARRPINRWGDAYEHVPAHSIGAVAALLVAVASRSLVRGRGTRAGRRAGTLLVGGWLAVALATSVELAGALPDAGSGDNAVHGIGIALLGPAIGLAVLGHLAVVMTARGRAARIVSVTAIGVTPLVWIGLTHAGSSWRLALTACTAAAWLAASWCHRRDR